MTAGLLIKELRRFDCLASLMRRELQFLPGLITRKLEDFSIAMLVKYSLKLVTVLMVSGVSAEQAFQQILNLNPL